VGDNNQYLHDAMFSLFVGNEVLGKEICWCKMIRMAGKVLDSAHIVSCPLGGDVG
jgi:hypothetical protein